VAAIIYNNNRQSIATGAMGGASTIDATSPLAQQPRTTPFTPGRRDARSNDLREAAADRGIIGITEAPLWPRRSTTAALNRARAIRVP